MKSVLGVHLCYQENNKRYLNTIHVLQAGGRKMLQKCALSWDASTHTPSYKKKKDKEKNNTTMRKSLSIREVCVAVSPSMSHENTSSKIWKYVVRTFRNILGFFFLLFKAKQSSTLALCRSFFLLS